jgi:hypothetical protein
MYICAFLNVIRNFVPSDPFIKMTVLKDGKRSDKKKSSIVYNTLNPYYNESFTFKNLSNNDMYSGVIYFLFLEFNCLSSLYCLFC